MIAPTAAQIKDWTELATLKAMATAKADRMVALAIATFFRFTGLPLADVPVELEPVVQQAIQGLAELLTYQQSADTLEALSDFDLIKSFSAGPYSETRRDAGDALKARLLVPWPWLSALLWGFMTDERREFYNLLFGGPIAPAWNTSEMDWGGYGGYGPLGGQQSGYANDYPMWGSDF